MKKLTSTLLFCAALAITANLTTGCGSTPATKAAQAEKIIITSVNDGMQEWAAYVNAGRAKKSQIDKVHTAYNDYYAAQLVAKAVIEKATSGPVTQAEIETANKSVTDAEVALLAILNSYLTK
jgi:ABC-type sugar transport system substrate-binding protein